MKNLLVTFFLLISYTYCNAQIYSWATTDPTCQSHYGARAKLAYDTAGNLFVAYTALNQSYYSSAITIVKYDKFHTVQWKQTITSWIIGEIDIAICTDNSGSVYITGCFYDSLFVGSALCTSVSSRNMFLIKLNSQGVFQWEKHSNGDACGVSLSSDAQNNVYVTGSINSNSHAYFDTNYLSIEDGIRTFIAKYSTDGVLLWIRGINPVGIPKVKADTLGNAYVTGTFNFTAQFGNSILTATDPQHYGAFDTYIAKIDASGNWQWAIKAGGAADDQLADLYMDSQNNLYITGYTESPSANFGDITITNPAMGDNYFAAKYNSEGNALWAISGGNPTGFGWQICADKQGNAYLSHSSSYLSKYDVSGNLLWSQTRPSATNLDMVADDSGSVYITGYFSSSVSFDSYTFTAAQKQMYVAQLYDPLSITTAISSFIVSEASTLFTVYPNPGSGLFTIRIAAEKPAAYTCTISNISGQTVYTETIQASGTYSKQINLCTFPKGSYYANLYCGSSADKKQLKECRKIVIQ